jgi:hypothetical protein
MRSFQIFRCRVLLTCDVYPGLLWSKFTINVIQITKTLAELAYTAATVTILLSKGAAERLDLMQAN